MRSMLYFLPTLLLFSAAVLFIPDVVHAGIGKYYRSEETRTYRLIERGDMEGVEKALENTPEWREDPFGYFQKAIDSCRLDILKMLVEKSGQDLKKTDQSMDDGSDFLMDAVVLQIDPNSNSRDADEEDVLEIVKFLISQGYEVKRTFNENRRERPLLHLAIEAENRLLVTYLLENGVDVEEQDEEATPLMAALDRVDAMKKDPFDISRILLKAGARLVYEASDAPQNSFSLLHNAVEEGNLDKVRFLIEQGAPLEFVYGGGTPLHAAVSGKAKEIVHFLVEQGADLEARTDFGWTPLLLATLDDVEMVQYFVDHGADIHAVTDNDRDALFLAAENGNEKLVDFFLAKKLDPRRVNLSGQGILTAAACGGNFAIFRKFADMGLDLNTRDSWGQTLLFPAAAGQNAEIVKYLLEHGVDVNSRRNDGTTAMELARNGKNASILIPIFRKAGGKETSNRAEALWFDGGAFGRAALQNSFVPMGMGGLGGFM